MDKRDLLNLERNAFLSVTELRQAQPKLAEALMDRLETRLRVEAVAGLPAASEKLRKAAAGIKIPVSGPAGKLKLREAALQALRESVARNPLLAKDPELKRELGELEKAAGHDATVGDVLRLDEPIAFNPEFKRDLDAARIYRLCDAAGIADATAGLLIEQAGSVGEVTSDRLAALVKEKKLKEAEARAVGVAVSLHHLLDERAELVQASGRGITSPADLVKYGKADWVRMIRDSGTKPPGGISADDYAELITRKVARAFPTRALAHRLAGVDVAAALKEHAGLAELRKLNPGAALAGTRDFDSLKTDGIAPAELKKLRERHQSTVRLVNRYAGMRLAEVLDDSSLSDAKKQAEVRRRTGIVNQLFAANPELLSMDLTPGSEQAGAVKFPARVSEPDKAMALGTVRTYQRVATLTEDPVDTEALVSAGFHSALTVAASRPSVIADRAGIEPAAAVRHQARAEGIAVSVSGHLGSIIDVIKDRFDDLGVGNLSPEVADYLKEIPGFADFFGHQSSCNCSHCQSIVGPAAYLMDLMSFVDDNVTQRFFASKPAHPLNLKTRRPDLWTLDLTCENTNKSIPYLTIINEILENAVARDAGFSGNFADRAAVERLVYRDTLPGQRRSFQQPMNLAFEELRTYLKHFSRSLGDVAEAGNAGGDALARLRLDLSPEEYQLITQPGNALWFLREVYTVNFQESSGIIQKFEAQELLKPMGVSRDELGELVSTRFVTVDGATNIKILGEKRSSESVQNDVENISGLTRSALDRMHRFVRLWRATGWRIGELDLVLTHLKQVGISSGIDNEAVQAVAHLHRLQSRHKVGAEEFTALWSQMPQEPIAASTAGSGAAQGSSQRYTVSLFDRLFNPARLVKTAGEYPQPAKKFLHPALASAPPAAVDPNLHRLQAGTGADDNQLYQLIVGLAGPLGIDLASSGDSKKSFALTLPNLSLLYRHARLARLLKLSIPDLFKLCGLASESGTTYVDGIPQLAALLKLHAWWKTTKWSLAELVRIIRPGLGEAASSAGLATAADMASQLVEQVAQTGMLLFADTLFALLPPSTPVATGTGPEITEDQSRQIIAANSGALEVAGADGRYRLKADFDPGATLTLPAGIDPALEPSLRGMLKAYHSRAVLLALLPGRAGVSPETAPHLLAMLGADLDDPGYFRELRGDEASAARIAALIPDLQRLATLFADQDAFDAENVAFLQANAAMFGVTDFLHATTAGVQRVELFRRLTEKWLASDSAPDLKGLLASFDPASRFAAADQEQLADVLGCDVGLAQSLQSHLSLSATPFEALRELLDAAELARAVGIGGDALKLAQSMTYDDLATASAAVQAAFRTRYADESEWEKKVEPFQDALLSRRRDGLVTYLIHSGDAPFDEVSDLYHYFLLDVEVEGCMRTSRVAAAVDSLQLYVHRCLQNLEETPPDSNDPVHVLPASIPDDEWAWRKNYRVWEANRKIFLYPENYIEPELRDDKTPLFKTLEEELLSKEITDEAILDAYGRYLRGFDELAHLTIAGSFHEKDEESRHDVLHLFGATAGNPPVFYYRRVEDAHYGAVSDDRATHWGAWEKLNIQVPVRKVAPIVHKGQLYLFWTRYTTKPVTTVVSGSSKFSGYQHRANVEFSIRRVDGSWTPPQPIRLATDPFNAAAFPTWYQKDGIINDLIVSKSKYVVGYNVKLTLSSGLKFTFWADAAGRTTLVLIGIVLPLQLPSSVMPNGGSFTMGDMTFNVTPVYASSLDAPLYDVKPHREPDDSYTLEGFGWDQVYPVSDKVLSLRGFNFQMWSPVDLFKLTTGARYEEDDDPATVGVPWTNPLTFEVLALIIWLLTGGKTNLLNSLPSRHIWSRASGTTRTLYASPKGVPCFDGYTFASLLVDEARFKKFKEPLAAEAPWSNKPQWSAQVTEHLESFLTETKVAQVYGGAGLEVVNGSVQDVIIQLSRDAFYLQDKARPDGRYHLRRLNTSLSEDIADILFNQGLEELLATRTQEQLAEHDKELTLVPSLVFDATQTGKIDYEGSMGTYLREIFFHIPFLIANHLNSQGGFDQAQRWYHYIFDPTASETITNLPAGLSDEERRRRELDRNWRYREFRGLSLDTLKAQLTDGEAIEAYKRDPFNPHAIARLRLSAYQKAIVMKYVDNLLDWGDDLFVKAFTQQNPEYLREATLKYVYAQEILGDRPAQIADCGEASLGSEAGAGDTISHRARATRLSPRSFAAIRDTQSSGSQFLMEVESIIGAAHFRAAGLTASEGHVAVDAERAAWATRIVYGNMAEPSQPISGAFAAIRKLGPHEAGVQPTAGSLKQIMESMPALVKETAGRVTLADAVVVSRTVKADRQLTIARFYDQFLKIDSRWTHAWGWSLVRQISPAFCVPGNDRMLRYWDRVEDRLYKLRHCQDIDGVVRLLPLFAPEIDPGLLVGGKARGLSLEDILGASAGSLPPYRFRYLVDKARGFAAVVQGFGASLLAALEKRDAEELTRLRNLHQKNLLALTTEVRKNELKIAAESIEIVARRQAAAEYRRGYYDDLISAGLTASEITQTAARIIASTIKAGEMALQTAASIVHLVPQVGSPFSMKYGGKELGDSGKSWAKALGLTAGAAELTATVAGIIAGFERREQGWEHQMKLAENDLKVIEKELDVAKLREAIASRSLELHDKAIEQQDEVIEFFANKFSNLGLYTYLSRTLQQLHREAYNNALAVARLAEQAYRFERPGDNTVFVGGEWDASRSGLLAGERLLMALNSMEKRFIETNTRQSEINQSFSLAQIDPQALIDLKEVGSCEFSIPEFYFDMYYPGQYRRRIKAVRLTIPCITGPYTNISAKLTLLRSQIRKEAVLGEAQLFEVPATRTSSVAMSTAQGDAGVFELSFRDEKYMPFEGAGAVSGWRLELPSSFRPFDYHSINDVILNISYTAEEDGVLRQQVESDNATIEGALLQYLTDNTLTRVFSLRQEFSNAFNRLIQAPAGTSVTIDITDRHFPLFLQERNLTVAKATMVVVTKDRAAVGSLEMSVNGTGVSGFSAPTNPPSAGDEFGGLPAADLGSAFASGIKNQHTMAVSSAGDLAAAPAAGSLLASDKLRDILLVVEYSL